MSPRTPLPRRPVTAGGKDYRVHLALPLAAALGGALLVSLGLPELTWEWTAGQDIAATWLATRLESLIWEFFLLTASAA